MRRTTGSTCIAAWPYRWRTSSHSSVVMLGKRLGLLSLKGRVKVGREGIGNPTSRDHNKASVLDVVLSRAPLTRNELIELTGLSKATVSRAVEELRADGFVVNGGVDEVTGRGRRSTNLDVPGTTGHVSGISFGVRTTCVVVADLRGREVQHVI